MKILLIVSAILAILIAPASAATKHHQHQTTTAYLPKLPSIRRRRTATTAPAVTSRSKQSASLSPMAFSPGFVVGSREYLAGAAIGSAIGGLIVHAQNYQNCMTLKGCAHN